MGEDVDENLYKTFLSEITKAQAFIRLCFIGQFTFRPILILSPYKVT